MNDVTSKANDALNRLAAAAGIVAEYLDVTGVHTSLRARRSERCWPLWASSFAAKRT